ncbi:von Willebrand factor D and EGF domain-containing protein-like [Elysia marginata]|uniref:von Willebrand factor D and EGF domain-containing protein-like n=1 Tax=Elysia marginata TaxID=1093978 RepID=A0AAV4HF44_9GAST|nr:von Willebrand factor D and EGF domain-containing protein-like [Elysia marginata]
MSNISRLVSTLQDDFPNEQGMTKDEAHTACLTKLQLSPLWKKCENEQEMISGVVDSCMEDILVSGSTDFIETSAVAFTDLCLAKVVEDPDNYDNNTDGELTIKVEYGGELCPEDCGDHGFCSSLTRGQCACQLGWTGDLCHIQRGQGVQLDRIRSGPLCDLSKRPCRKVFLDAYNLDLSDDLVCAVTVANAQGNETLSVETTKADYLSAGRISCEIPTSGDHTFHFFPPANARLCGLAVRHSIRDREVSGSIPGRVKPRTLKLVLAADPPSVLHYGFILSLVGPVSG